MFTMDLSQRADRIFLCRNSDCPVRLATLGRKGRPIMIIYNPRKIAGWWYTYPSEKCENQLG